MKGIEGRRKQTATAATTQNLDVIAVRIKKKRQILLSIKLSA